MEDLGRYVHLLMNSMGSPAITKVLLKQNVDPSKARALSSHGRGLPF